MNTNLICPVCGNPKSFYAKACMKCRKHNYTSQGMPDHSERLTDPPREWMLQFVGLFFGEGTATIIYRASKETYAPRVEIKMRADEMDMLEEVRRYLGGRTYHRPAAGNSAPMYGWEIANVHGCLRVLKLIQDHAVLQAKKRGDVEIVIRFLEWRLQENFHHYDKEIAASFVQELRAYRVFKLHG